MILEDIAIKALISSCAVSGVPSDYLEAIIKHESAGGHVFAVGTNSIPRKSLLPKTKQESIAAINYAVSAIQNNENIDVGLGQINTWNIKKRNLDVNKLFEPCYNIKIASIIFEEAISRSCGLNENNKSCLDGALRIYNTGRSTSTEVGLRYTNHINSILGFATVAVNFSVEIEGTELVIPGNLLVEGSDAELFYRN